MSTDEQRTERLERLAIEIWGAPKKDPYQHTLAYRDLHSLLLCGGMSPNESTTLVDSMAYSVYGGKGTDSLKAFALSLLA